MQDQLQAAHLIADHVKVCIALLINRWMNVVVLSVISNAAVRGCRAGQQHVTDSSCRTGQQHASAPSCHPFVRSPYIVSHEAHHTLNLLIQAVFWDAAARAITSNSVMAAAQL